MAGTVAHHFNNKLTAVMGYLELALNAAGQNPKLLNHLLQVRRASVQAPEVSNLMLAYLVSIRKPRNLSYTRTGRVYPLPR